MPDQTNKSKKPLAILAVVLLLCALAVAWLVLKPRREKAANVPPIAALQLDSIDETNRVATVSDGGSHDPDGTLRSWRISWGDGKEEDLSSMPRKSAHTYSAEGEYTISLWCVDNLGASSSPPAMTNVTFDFQKRQKALELAQAEAKRQADAKREADRLKEEEAKKQAERLEQERQKQMQLAALEAQKAKEQQEALEKKRQAEAELARQKAKEAATPPPAPLAAALANNPWAKLVSYTPRGSTLGAFEIHKERTEAKGPDGKIPVILFTRCVNFPDTPIPTADWQIDGKVVSLHASRIRASLSPGQHQVTAVLTPKAGLPPTEVRADLTVGTTGE